MIKKMCKINRNAKYHDMYLLNSIKKFCFETFGKFTDNYDLEHIYRYLIDIECNDTPFTILKSVFISKNLDLIIENEHVYFSKKHNSYEIYELLNNHSSVEKSSVQKHISNDIVIRSRYEQVGNKNGLTGKYMDKNTPSEKDSKVRKNLFHVIKKKKKNLTFESYYSFTKDFEVVNLHGEVPKIYTNDLDNSNTYDFEVINPHGEVPEIRNDFEVVNSHGEVPEINKKNTILKWSTHMEKYTK